jgi:hypothetical protein
MLCTGGRPSDAVRLLLSSLREAGAVIRHHGDFDEAGVQILRDLEARYRVLPWRFDLAALCEADARTQGGVAVMGEAGATTLEDAVAGLTSCLAEELVIDELIEDLKSPRPRFPALPGPPK